LIEKNFKGKKKQFYINLVMLAYRQAKNGHRNQLRKDKVRYFEHCKSVSLIIMLEFKVYLAKAIIAGFLHDIKEDQFILSWWDIKYIFKESIRFALWIITKDKNKDYYFGILNVPKRYWWIILVKLADRLHNMRDILKQSKKFMLKQLRETEKIYPNLLDVFETKVPRKYRHLPDYIRGELEFACNKIRKKLGMPRSIAFKRVK